MTDENAAAASYRSPSSQGVMGGNGSWAKTEQRYFTHHDGLKRQGKVENANS